ncbi:hypothetical protein QQM79_15235 [Marinobacteraceae bacterium S3BR75-40.1]
MKKALLPLITASLMGTLPVYAAFDDAGTDYSNQTTDSWTWTPGLEPMSTPNEILCFIRSLRAGEMVNQGTYTALVNMAECSTGQQDNNDNRGPDNITAVVNSTRASNDDPQIVKVWIPRMEDGPDGAAQQIRALAVVRESPSAANPAGDFTMTFKTYDADNTEAGPIGAGQLQAVPNDNGNVSLTFYESSTFGSETYESAATIEKNATAGTAITRGEMGPEGMKTYKLSWNETRALVDDPDSADDVCLAKDETEQNVFRYEVFNYADGSKVDVEGGFPFEFDNGDERVHGYMGYWGLWMEDESLFQDGMTVDRMDFSSGEPTATPVTLHSSGGRLNKITTESKTLDAVTGVRFRYWEGSSNYIAEYMASGSAGEGFYKVATEDQSQDGPPQVTELSSPEKITPPSGSTRIDLYSDQLGGSVTILLDGSGNLLDKVVLRKRETVSPSDLSGDLTLYCAWNCPSSQLDATTLGTGGNPYVDTSTSNAQYTFDATNMVLKQNGGAVVWPDSLSQGSVDPQYQGGIYTGVLTTTETALDTFTSGNDLTTWYEWETGPNTWSQSYWATQNSEVITIDPPMFLSLTFSAAADRDDTGADFYNEPFMLEYSGNGDLFGLPFEDDGNGRYKPAVNLADGTVLDAAEGNGQYVVKATQAEYSLIEKTDGSCSTLSLTAPTTPLPTAVDSDAQVNTDPVPSPIPSPAAVINGEVVISN